MDTYEINIMRAYIVEFVELKEIDDNEKEILRKYNNLFSQVQIDLRNAQYSGNTKKYNETLNDFILVSGKVGASHYKYPEDETQIIQRLTTKYPTTVDTSTAPKQQSEESRVVINNKVLKGLPNFGNSCYINAALQCIASIDEIKLPTQNEQLDNFLNNYHKSKDAALTKEQMGFITKPYFYYIGQQDDSADILGRIIDKLSNKEFSKVNTKKTYKCENDVNDKAGRPSIENIFSVAMYTNKKNIQAIIDESYKPVVLPEGSNMLELCANDQSKRGKATTETSIAYFEGNYAIIQLKRFYTEFINGAYIHRKINDPITVEKTITLKTNKADQTVETKFVFHSMINHSGDRLNSGHYTANVLIDNILYNCNDSIITKEKEISDNTIVENSIQVYVVIYKKNS